MTLAVSEISLRGSSSHRSLEDVMVGTECGPRFRLLSSSGNHGWILCCELGRIIRSVPQEERLEIIHSYLPCVHGGVVIRDPADLLQHIGNAHCTIPIWESPQINSPDTKALHSSGPSGRFLTSPFTSSQDSLLIRRFLGLST
jgi:hypothetical protein